MANEKRLMSTPSVEKTVVDVAYGHHERIDGTGYPRKASGEEISYYSRIISIVDAYDAMTADRCYQKAKPTTLALKIIYEQRDKQFDNDLALQFIKTIGLFPVGSVVELYTGEIGVVVEANQNLRHLPRVVAILDQDKNRNSEYRMIDLSHIEHGDLGKENLIKRVLANGTFGVYLKNFQKGGALT